MKVMLLMWSDGSYAGAGQFHEGAAGRVVTTELASPGESARPL